MAKTEPWKPFTERLAERRKDHLHTLIDGLDAACDGRGYTARHDRARVFVERSIALVERLASHPEDAPQLAKVAAQLVEDVSRKR
jgi:hypothetical protein